MAITQNTFTGNGSNLGPFSFTFKWLEPTDIKVTVAGVLKTVGTHYNLQSLNYTTKTGGQVLFTAGNAPANNAAIVIYRQTDDTDLASTFYSGSAIRAQDLNDNFIQGLYVTQEANNNVVTANTTANAANTTANTALSNSTAAVSTANTASANASAAVSTANTASSNASAAVSTANTASSNATAAVNTANTASTNASNAVTTANTALSTANTASSNASAAVATANTASSNASAAVSTANTASSNATTAVNTANNALSTANAATSTANTASTNATAALNAVANSLQYVLVANVAAIPSSPANNYAIEVANSTGIESFSPLANRPAGFVGDVGLSVRMQYSTTGPTWNWLNYFPNNAETRYLKFGGGTITGNLEIGNTGSLTFEGATANAFETTLAVTDPTADRTITLPDVSGTVVTTGDTGTVTSTMIADGTIIDADINASAGIAGTKVSPSFGAQNINTTGTATAASFIPASSTAPTNGVYLPSANTVGISTNGTGRLFVDSSGNVGVGISSAAARCQIDNPVSLSGSGNNYVFIAGNTSSASRRAVAIGVDGVDGNAVLAGYNTLSPGLAALLIDGSDLRFRTGSTERMRLDSSGRLGLGSSTPNCQLTNTGTTSLGTNAWPTSALSRSNGRAIVGNEGQLILWNETVGAGNAGQLYIGTKSGSNSTDLGYARISAGTENASNLASFFKLETMNSSGTLGAGLYIDSSQRVGVGTSTPGATLDVAPDANRNIQILGRAGTTYGMEIKNATAFTTSELHITAASAGSVVFNRATTESARIDSNGRLLVGTSSGPSSGQGQFSLAVVQGYKGVSIGAGDLSIQRGQAATAMTNGDDIGYVKFNDNAGNTFASIAALVDATPGASDFPGRLVFSTTADGASSPTERMRITNSGNSALYTQDTGATLLNMQTAASAGTSAALVTGTYGATGVFTGTVSIRIWSNGNIQNTNNSYGALSDIKLKENVVDANSQWSDIKALQVRNYNLKEGQTHTQIGLIAQEVEPISPGLVYESPDRDAEGNDLGTTTKSVNYSVLYMKAVKALQEAMERIETLEAKVAALESA